MQTTTAFTRAIILATATLALPTAALGVATIPEDEVFAREARREVIHIRIQEGCDIAATDRVSVQIPEGVLGVIPAAVPGWSATIEVAETEPYELFGQRRTDRVESVEWTGGPLPAEQFQDFGILAVFTEPTDELVIPVTQGCGEEEQSWDEVPQDGEARADLQFPAPVVSVVEPPDTDIAGLQADLGDLRTQLEDLRTEFDGLRLGEIPGDRLREQLDDVDARLAEVEEQLEQAPEEPE
jgi:periplasmic copper chaperone A